MAPPGMPAASRVSWMCPVSTGCGLVSMNSGVPCPAKARMPSSNRTGLRRLVYQYAAFSSAWPMNAPASEEQKATSVGRGETSSSVVSSSSRSASMCGVWAA